MSCRCLSVAVLRIGESVEALLTGFAICGGAVGDGNRVTVYRPMFLEACFNVVPDFLAAREQFM